MKSFLLSIGALILIIATTSFSPDDKLPIEGVWQLEKGKYISEDTTVTYPTPPSGRHMKIISESYFSTVWQGSGDELEGFNGGSYTLKGDRYIETNLYSSWINEIDSKVYFQIKIENDRLYLYPTNDKGELQKYGFFEQWKRME